MWLQERARLEAERLRQLAEDETERLAAEDRAHWLEEEADRAAAAAAAALAAEEEARLAAEEAARPGPGVVGWGGLLWSECAGWG